MAVVVAVVAAAGGEGTVGGPPAAGRGPAMPRASAIDMEMAGRGGREGKGKRCRASVLRA